jgi:KDO2-lipid IV(A) lauroyltransferase
MGRDNTPFLPDKKPTVSMAFLFRLLAYLPLPVLHNLGALAGWLAWLLSPTYRRHLRENMAQAGVAGLAGVRHAAIAEAGKTLFELPKLWLRPPAEILGRVVRVEGWEHVEAAHAAGRGILFFTPHLGCFEITAQLYAGYRGQRPITVLYRRPKQDWLAPLIEQGRGATLKLAPADMGGVRRLIKALKSNEAVGMLPDQAPGVGEGEWVPFFGRPAYTMTLAARLAQTGATVLLAYAERLSYGTGYAMHFLPPSGPVATPADVNREIEQLVLRHPGQYLWGYNRYKGKPDGTAPGGGTLPA